MSKARDGVEDLKTIDANFAAKAPIASPSFTGGIAVTGSTAHTAGDITNSIAGTYKLFGANGTAGSNSYVTYCFEGDNDTGMNWTGNNNLQLVTAGATAIKINAAGIVTKPLQPSFRVGSSAGFSAATNMTHNITYHNIGNHYNSSNGRFTAPVAGVYFLGMHGISGSSTASTEQNTKFIKNGSTFITDNRTRGYTEGSYHLQTVLELAAGDYVIVSQDAGTTYASAQHNQFMGHLIG